MNTTYSDKEKITDALMSQRFITGNYNNFANESAHPEIKQVALELLSEEHAIQHEVFVEMQNHGWYKVQQAPAQAVTDARNQLENC